jgi:hypothetical protein
VWRCSCGWEELEEEEKRKRKRKRFSLSQWGHVLRASPTTGVANQVPGPDIG